MSENELFDRARSVVEQAREALVESEQRFRVLTETSFHGLILVSPQGSIVQANQAFAAMFGYPLAGMVGVRLAELFTVESLSLLRSQMEGDPGKSIEVVGVRRDGKDIQIEIAGNHIDIDSEPVWMIAVREVYDSVRLNEAIMKASRIDPLTELLNRQGLQDVLSREVAESSRRGDALGVLLIDLDDFWKLNDSLGQVVGDLVLQEVAKRLQFASSDTDCVARVGGDEFVMLMPNRPLEDVVQFGEKVRLAISGEPMLVATEPVVMTASIAAITITDQTPSVDELLSQAQIVLKSCKADGKNQVSLGLPGKSDTVNESVRSGNILDSFRNEYRFRVLAQALRSLPDEHIVGYELLSRAAARGFEMPDDFFRVFTETNMLTLVDHQCFRNCMTAARALPPTKTTHVNIFPSTLLAIPIDHLIAELTEVRPAGSWCIEISERQILGDPSNLEEAVSRLKDAGLRIAMDDVGFGRSCLESLVHFQPDVIKLDKSLVIGISRSSEMRDRLKLFIKVLGGLDSVIVAEGIENRDDLGVVIDMGIPVGQGFLWGMPE